MKDKKQIREMLQFQDLSEEEKKARGILGRLYGPCASIIDATRNGRCYGDALWKNVFGNNEIVKEMFENGGIPMELDHPVDREETCSEKIAAMLPEPPKEDHDGHLICYVDLIDTPCGRIAYQLAKYGFKLGISSRGTGDLYTDEFGNESVDPDTYDFTTFDLVLLPAVKDARLSMCESLDTKNLKLNEALAKDYNEASIEDKRVMKTMLEALELEELVPDTKLIESDLWESIPEEDLEEEEIVDEISELEDEEIAVEAELSDEIAEEENTEEKSEDESKNDEESSVDENSEDVESNDAEEPIEDEIEEETSVEELEDSKENIYTIGNLLKDINEYKEDLPVEFADLTIDGNKYSIKMLNFTELPEDNKVVINLDYIPKMEDNIANDSQAEENLIIDTDAIEVTSEEEPVSENTEDTTESANEIGEEDIIESVKEIVRQKELLEQEVRDLKTREAVGNAEVLKLKEDVEKYRTSFIRVSEVATKAKDFEAEVKALNEQLANKNTIIEQLQQVSSTNQTLTENINAGNEKIKVLTEKLNTATTNAEGTEKKFQATLNQYKQKLTENTNIAKEYKIKFQEVMSKYIASKAEMLGVSTKDITSKLAENYSTDDVDAICETILTEGISMSSLPFGSTRKAMINIKSETAPKTSVKNGYDIDNSLLELAGLIGEDY